MVSGELLFLFTPLVPLNFTSPRIVLLCIFLEIGTRLDYQDSGGGVHRGMEVEVTVGLFTLPLFLLRPHFAVDDHRSSPATVVDVHYGTVRLHRASCFRDSEGIGSIVEA